jgi:hypothetical protein
MLRVMGAWDVTPFANDDAADWATTLIDAAQPETLLAETLQAAHRSGYLEAADGSQVVAAAALVATACDPVSDGIPAELAMWLHGREGKLKLLAPAALAAIRRVRGAESELRELWEAREDFAAWSNELEMIAARLR